MKNRNWITMFCFLGPIGNMIPILSNVAGAKVYFILIALGNAYLLYNWRKYREVINTLTVILPLIIYMFISAGIGYLYFGNVDILGVGENILSYNPILRVVLTYMLLTYVLFISLLAGRYELADRLVFVTYFLKGYVVSLIGGYLILVLYYTHTIDISTIAMFELLPQFSWGMLRFAPGSTANEYGILTSYVLSILTLIIVHRNKECVLGLYERIKGIYIIYILALCALFMTTTRSAYISYFMAVIYIIFSKTTIQEKFKRLIISLILTVVMFFVIYKAMSLCLNIDIVDILHKCYVSITDEHHTVSDRLKTWAIAYNAFLNNMWFGVGAGRAYMIHNTYLQLLTELGLVGSGILLFYIVKGVRKIFMIMCTCDNRFMVDMVIVGIAHVLWFSASNHNLNQFLTWYVVFTILLLVNKTAIEKIEA